ncbi:MAG TPA: HPr family phosphocarrier protein [Clostridia bacterium]|nr:HPr family phosphocarrier protein [Clostridia bacterium]
MHIVETIIHDEIGLHARPAARFSKAAAGFQSEIKIRKEGDDSDFNAKSITAVLRMGAVRGTKVIITAEGPDEKEACDSLLKTIE